MDKTEFYAECDRILGQKHKPPKTYRRRGRWGPREPGSGRFEGYGLVRWFNANTVHIALHHPHNIQGVRTAPQALALLETLVR